MTPSELISTLRSATPYEVAEVRKILGVEREIHEVANAVTAISREVKSELDRLAKLCDRS